MRFGFAIAVAVVGGLLAPAGRGAMAQTMPGTATVAVQKGATPLDVTVKADGGGVTYFGGVFIEFGDGHRQLLCAPGQGCGGKQVQHRYEHAGTFTIKLVGLGEPDQKPLAETTANVPLK